MVGAREHKLTDFFKFQSPTNKMSRSVLTSVTPSLAKRARTAAASCTPKPNGVDENDGCVQDHTSFNECTPAPRHGGSKINRTAGNGSCPVPIISLEAIIGAGKSTLLEAVKLHFGEEVVIVQEVETPAINP